MTVDHVRPPDLCQDTGMYFVHVWKSCGMKMDNVRFIWASDFIEENATEPLGESH